MGVQQIYEYHNLTPQPDYACTGFFTGTIDEHSEEMSKIYYNYPATIKTLTEGGEEPIINFEFQSKFKVKWLSYNFQALWIYEMAAHYPFLYKNISDIDLVSKCIETSLDNNIFLHFAGGWHESNMISSANHIPFNDEFKEKFLLYLAPPVELMVNPVAAVFTVRVSVADESVKAGTAIGGVVGAGAGNWIGFGFPQSAGRLDSKSIKLLNGEYSTGAELIIFPLFVLTETEKL